MRLNLAPTCQTQDHRTTSMAVPVIALYGSLNAILNIVLASRVSNARVKHKV